ncbi:uncharacterized protein si:ch211-180a12.2 [Megalops cyprinoides]|uniref:uncharacterized protein si:ch211-180a12.2 n=1 Tax=Megalops cyprinoides TaxID=118141 RepID=UPI00186532A3|nr:uncharacterized protein si:ch211-180a12.2 [Megalops cyprinoides]
MALVSEFRGKEEPEVNSSLLEVSWIHNGIVTALSGTNGTYTEEGFSLDPSAFANGTFSLTVHNTSLSHQGEYVCNVSFNNTELYSANVTITIIAPPSLTIPSSVVVLNRESVIKCRAEGFTPPLIYFSWMRGGEVVRRPRPFRAVNRTSDGYFWAVSSLALTATAQDRGVNYSCVVNHTALKEPLPLSLSLSELPTVTLSTIHNSSPASPLTLSCDISGFYPREISVSWLQNGSILPDPPLIQPGLDGSFKTRHFRTLSVEERKRSGEVQCVVQQPAVTDPVSATLDLSITDSIVEETVLTKSAKASVALMIISLVLVFLLCFGFSWRRRDEKLKSLSVSGVILPPRVIVGQKGRVTVSVEGRRVDRVQTAWFLNDTPISDTSHAVTEKGPLLPPGGEVGYYKLHTQRPLQSGNGSTQQLLTSLTFIPHLSIHKGAVFKCQISYKGKDKVVVERVSDKFTLLAAPEVSEIQLSEPADGSGIVTLTAQASRFHPDIITFRWFCQGGELSPVAPPPPLSAPRPDAQGFFSAVSQCKLPRAELERGETKVWVTVHHMALKQPITRETRGFIKRPHVSEITSCSAASTFSPENPLTLGCEITRFYPPEISVSWWRVTEGESEEEITEGADIWGPALTHPSAFRATATLRKGRSEGDGEEKKTRIVCRVMHCSLQEPIERHWQDNHSAAPSIPSSISVQWKKGGIGVFSLTLSGGHPRAKLLWVAGGATLSPLISKEREVEGEDGSLELRSMCAVQTFTGRVNTDRHVHTQRNGHVHKPEEELSL